MPAGTAFPKTGPPRTPPSNVILPESTRVLAQRSKFDGPHFVGRHNGLRDRAIHDVGDERVAEVTSGSTPKPRETEPDVQGSFRRGHDAMLRLATATIDDSIKPAITSGGWSNSSSSLIPNGAQSRPMKLMRSHTSPNTTHSRPNVRYALDSPSRPIRRTRRTGLINSPGRVANHESNCRPR